MKRPANMLKTSGRRGPEARRDGIEQILQASAELAKMLGACCTSDKGRKGISQLASVLGYPSVFRSSVLYPTVNVHRVSVPH